MSIESLMERDFEHLLKHARDHAAGQLEQLDRAIAGDKEARTFWAAYARNVLTTMARGEQQ